MMANWRVRSGSIPTVLAVVGVLGVVAASSMFMTNSTARLEKVASLGFMADSIAQAAIEETLVKAQNGSIEWAHNVPGEQAVKLSYAPAATSLMYGGKGVTISPVKIMGRPIIEPPQSDLRNAFYSIFAGTPNYHPNHAANWEDTMTGPEAALGRAPDGVTIDQNIAQSIATAGKDSLPDDPVRQLALALPVLTAGRDHTEAELADFFQKVTGDTLTEALANARAQDRPAPAAPPSARAPAPAPASPGPSAQARPRQGGQNNNPQAPGSLNQGLNAAANAQGASGCGNPPAPVNAAIQVLPGEANLTASSALNGKDAIVKTQSRGGGRQPRRIDSKHPFVRFLNRLTQQGPVLGNQPHLLSLEADVECTLGFGMSVKRRASAQRVIAEYHSAGAVNYVAGRLLKYWCKFNNLTVNDLYLMGFVNNTTAPEARFDRMFPDVAQFIPKNSYQVWPFEVAGASTGL